MSSAEFFRLYRDLCRGETKRDDIENLYEKQRKEVLHSLKYDVGKIEELVPISKHHGKRARRRANEKHSKFVHSFEAVERAKRQHQLMINLNILNEAVNEATTLLMDNKPLPPRLGRKIESNPQLQSSSSAKGLIPKDCITSVKMKPPSSSFVGPGFPEDIKIINKISSNKWSNIEIERLNQLYFEISKPTNNHEDSWRIYYLRIARRFIATFPKRNEAETIEKIHDLLSKHQLKEPGESSYWSELKKTNNL